MKLSVRSRSAPEVRGLRAPVRVDRRPRALLSRLEPGDIAVIDQIDLDRGSAQALRDAGVSAVLNAAPMLSGRYPALGPQLLAEAGVLLVDGIGDEGFRRLRDGSTVVLDEGAVVVGDQVAATGRPLDPDLVAEEMEAARAGLAAQLQSFTHNSTEFLRREQDLLLHGHGVPRVSARIAGRPVLVVVDKFDHAEQLRGVRRFVREQDPVLVGVEGGADALALAGHRPDVVVLDADAGEDQLPHAAVLRRAKDVVVRVDRGSRRGLERLERLGVRPLRFETGATAEDAALVLADTADASVIVGVGLHATLDEFLDRQRPGLASTYLTRLKVGARLVDARSLPTLYSGRVRPWHLFTVLVAGLLALLAAIGVTPVGQQAVDALLPHLADLADAVRRIPQTIRGAP